MEFGTHGHVPHRMNCDEFEDPLSFHQEPSWSKFQFQIPAEHDNAICLHCTLVHPFPLLIHVHGAVASDYRPVVLGSNYLVSPDPV